MRRYNEMSDYELGYEAGKRLALRELNEDVSDENFEEFQEYILKRIEDDNIKSKLTKIYKTAKKNDFIYNGGSVFKPKEARTNEFVTVVLDLLELRMKNNISVKISTVGTNLDLDGTKVYLDQLQRAINTIKSI